MGVFKTIGMMSGTSLDGLDIAYCVFDKQDGLWTYKLCNAMTIEYPEDWRKRLQNSVNLSAAELAKLDVEYGHYLGNLCQRFIESNHLAVDLVASHGHTVFHQPQNGFTVQIGSGPAIRTHVKVPVIFDFRSQDVALGGQGAPLVPIGDLLLFRNYEACLNIGGFANISLQDANQQRIAWDICPANYVLNPLAQQLGFAYDNKGKLAQSGKVDPTMLKRLNDLNYYLLKGPKTLGSEWVNTDFFPRYSDIETKDLLATLTQHIAIQIANSLPQSGKVLITGGGAKNDFLMQLIQQNTAADLHIPESALIDFKEALIFAFLGALRHQSEVNVLASVTGAQHNHSSGSMVL